MKQTKPTYEELELRCRAAESALEAIRSGQTDVVLGDQGLLVLHLAETERALQDAEQRYRLLVEQSPAVVYENEVGGPWVYLSPQVEKVTGYTPEELIQTLGLWQHLIHPADLPNQEKAIREGLENAQPIVAEYRITARDGRTIWLHDEANAFQDPQTARTLLRGMFYDITKRKQAELSLQEHEQKLNKLLEFLPVGVSILDVDNQVVFDNPALQQILQISNDGLRKGEYRNREYLASNGTPMPPDGFASVQANIKGQAIYDVETGVMKEDGEVIWTNVSAVPVDFPDWKTVIVTADITQRKQAEEGLRESEERYRLISSIVSDYVFSTRVDEQGVLHHEWLAGAFEEITGYTNEEYVACGGWRSRLHPEDREIDERDMAKLRNNETVITEIRTIKKDGTVIWVQVYAHPLWDQEQNRLVGIYGAVKDITGSKQAKEYLRASEGRFRSLVDQSADGILMIDETGKILEWNHGEESITGIPRSQVIGRYVWDIQYETVPPERRALRTSEYLKESFLSGLLTGMSPYLGKSFDAEIVTVTGERKFIQQTAFLVEGQTGKSLGAIVRDITERKQAEEKLRESEERFRTVADFTYDWEYWLDEDRTLLYISPSCERITEYTQNDFLKDPGLLHAIVHPDDRAAYDHHMQEELQGLEPSSLDFRILTARGDVRWIAHTCRHVVDQHGLARGRRISNREITERKQAEIKLQESEEKYRGLLESLDSIVATVDLNGKFLYMNDRAAELVGDATEQWIGKSMYDLFPIDSADQQMAILRSIMEDDHGRVFESLIAVNDQPRWYRTFIQPLHDEAGQVNSVLVNSTDIHTLKTMQEQLEELNHLLEEKVKARTAEVVDLYDNAPAGYHSLDIEGRISKINQTELNWFGYTREEMLGRSIMEFLSPASLETFRLTFPEFIRMGRLTNQELEFIRKDGSAFPVLVNATALYDAQGRFIMSRSTIIDNTQHKKAEIALRHVNSELERAMRIKDEFLANMSHELRTPLSAIIGLSESLLENTFGNLNSRQNKYIVTINESGQHLLTLINDILDLAKIGAGQVTLEHSLVDVNAVCQSSLRMIKQISQKKKQQVQFEIDTDVEFIMADERRLKQVIVNLLSNAVKFTPEEGQIGLEVRGDQTNQWVRFTVWDTGVGISSEDQARLFKPFVQVNSSLTRGAGGTGLGLALVAKIANMHGGSVGLESEPDKGSRFYFILPWNKQPSPETDSQPPLEALETPIETPHLDEKAHTILLVENTETAIMTIRDYLVHAGYHLEVAHNGQEAITLAIQVKPDLILMDIPLPEVDGLEATRNLRREAEFKDTPIIALTASAMSGDRERCLEAGATAHMSKPINLKRLVLTIEHFLQQKKA